MASSRIAGITIELDGDTTKLQDSLKGVDKSLKTTQTQLKDVDKLLKLDPTNVDLLKQRHELLGQAVNDTEDKLRQEKLALEQLKNADPSEENAQKQKALEREIVATEASLKGYKKELDQSNVSLQVVGKTAEQVAQKTKALSMAAAGFGAALIGNAYKSAQFADDLNTLSKQTGFSTDELQKMQYASDLIDVSFDSMTGSIRKVVSNMNSGAEIFDTLGVSIYDANGNMRDATDVWYDSIEALSQVQNETERDALSMELFGKSALEMAGIVDDGGASLKALGEEAEQAGIIISGDALNSANEFNDAIDRFKATAQQSFMKAGATLAEVLTPALERVATAVSNVLTWFANLDGTQQGLILTITAVVAAISPVASAIAAVTSAIGTLKTAWTAISGAFTAFSGPVGIVIAVIGALIAVGILLYKNWDTIKEKATELWEKLKEVFANIKKHIENVINGIKTGITNTLNAIKTTITTVFNAIKSVINTVIDGIKTGISNGFDNIKTTVTNVTNAIKTVMTTVWNAIKSVVTTVTDGIKTAISNTFNNIKSTVTNVVNGIKSVISTVFNGIKSTVSSITDGIRTKVTSVFDAIKNGVSNAVNTIKNVVSNVFGVIKGLMTNPFETAWNIISGIVDRLKSIFNFSWSLPSIALPHFRVDGGQWPYGIGGRGWMPSFSVDWYAKAMENGMILRNPTIFGMNNGQLMGAGEAGSETIVGTNSLMKMIQSAVGNAPTINMTVNANGMNADELSSLVVDKITRQITRTNQRW